MLREVRLIRLLLVGLHLSISYCKITVVKVDICNIRRRVCMGKLILL